MNKLNKLTYLLSFSLVIIILYILRKNYVDMNELIYLCLLIDMVFNFFFLYHILNNKNTTE